MKRMALAVVVVCACCTGPVRADTLPMIDNLPATYTPGQAFTFQLTLPALTDFSDYNLQLIFDTDVQNPPLFASGAAATSKYPFPSSAGFQSTLSRDSTSNQITLTIADSTSPNVTVTPGTNDALATITVTPGADFTGEIRLSVGTDSVFHYNTEDNNFDFPTNIPPIEQGASGPVSAPAPPGALLLGAGALILGLRMRLRR
jgi:hypothetical protein